MQSDFVAKHPGVPALSHQTAYERAVRLMRTAATKAFDLKDEPPKLRDRYGRNLFGQGCLLARRLVERGVPFVEVTLANANGLNGIGWDTHQQNFERVKNLSEMLDPAWATLMDDLEQRGLLDTTLIVWMGEFGRTPKINPQQGRDHLPNAWSTVLAGGGIKGGRSRQDQPRRHDGQGQPGQRAELPGHRRPGAGHRSDQAEHVQRRPAHPHRRRRRQADQGGAGVRTRSLAGLAVVVALAALPRAGANAGERGCRKSQAIRGQALESNAGRGQAAPKSNDKAEGKPLTIPVIDYKDFVFMASDRPVLVRLHLRINGRPYSAAWDDYMKKFFTYFDKNGDGALDKAEAERAPGIQFLQYHLQGNIGFPYQGQTVSHGADGHEQGR